MIKINKKYLPSKKFLVAVSIALSVIILVLIFNLVKPIITSHLNKKTVDTNTDVTSFANINLDSDGDGLPDWKEALYGTDPHKADTDGDGTNDGDEIAQGRDPLKPNTAPAGQEPNDKIDPAIIAENKKALDEYEKLNAIDRFSRDLVSNIIASQPTNGPMSTDTINMIVSKAAAEMPQENYSPITKITDLNLQKTDSTNLAKNMADYTKNYYTETQKLVPLSGMDIQIIGLYITDSGKNNEAQMLNLIDSYQKIVDDLIKMPVPVAIGHYDINYHLKIINDLEKMIAIDKNVISSDKDSLDIFSNLSNYKSVMTDLFSVLNNIDTILKIQR